MEFIRDENKMTDNQITLQIEISLIIDRLQNGLIHPMTAKAELYEASLKQGQTLLISNLSKCYSLGTKLLLNSNDLQDEEVVILDLTSSGCPYVCGENFEGFIPQLTNKK
jgi:hypothetical protein